MHTEEEAKTMSTLPDPNRRVVAFLKGTKHHSDVGWVREGWAFMVRWENAEPGHTVASGWSRELYDKALKQIDADYAEVDSWVYVSDLSQIIALKSTLQSLLANYDDDCCAITFEPDPGCLECTSGVTPNNRYTGPCLLHTARSLLSHQEES